VAALKPGSVDAADEEVSVPLLPVHDASIITTARSNPFLIMYVLIRNNMIPVIQ
jgi:hypothetical protein